MKHILLTIIVIISSLSYSQSQHDNSLVVLELFTSQGCSSCPSADALLGAVSAHYSKEEVITLSYHVDYWNYIGWKDPFSKKQFTEKQRQYGSKFFSSSIYTPQVVVNGKEHFVGSDENKMNTKLKEYRQKSSDNKITLKNVKNTNGLISFDFEVEGNIDQKWLSIYLVINERTTEVKRGENRNRTLLNSNIVVNESSLELTESGKGSISIPDIVEADDTLSLVVIAQKANLDITGGRQMTLR